MTQKFVINTSALVYNSDGKILYAVRSAKEAYPGIQSYPGGKVEFDEKDMQKDTESIINILEKTLKRKLKEKLNLEIDSAEYFHSHCYVNNDNEKIVLLAFLCPLKNGSQISTDNDKDNTTGFGWISKNEVDSLKTLEVVKQVYRQAFLKLENKLYHQYIEVGGIVLNDKQEFLMLREAESGKYTFPHGPVENLPGRTWEVLEKNLIRNIYIQTAVEVNDGLIPFTDTEFLGHDGFEKIIQFFICKYSRGTAMATDQFVYSEALWKDISTLKEKEFKPLVYLVFKKALEFINKINN